jgi:hypothetical protein
VRIRLEEENKLKSGKKVVSIPFSEKLYLIYIYLAHETLGGRDKVEGKGIYVYICVYM